MEWIAFQHLKSAFWGIFGQFIELKLGWGPPRLLDQLEHGGDIAWGQHALLSLWVGLLGLRVGHRGPRYLLYRVQQPRRRDLASAPVTIFILARIQQDAHTLAPQLCCEEAAADALE